jgi:hypothetical protein
MYIFTLVGDVYKVVENLRIRYGEFKLAMLYNSELDIASNWNLIVSSDWTERLGVAESTRVIARELHDGLGLENRLAVSRVTVLATSDPFVQDMSQLMSHTYPAGFPRQGGVPLSHLSAGGVTGAGFIFYSQPAVEV